MPNPTMAKFGFPQTLVRQYGHWAVLVRPAQPTLGSLVLAATSDVTAYGELPDEAFGEQGHVVGAIEQSLRRFCDYERINYLMLMMVDPNVHFHVVPRYSGSRSWRGVDFPDAGWPGPPDLKAAVALDGDVIAALVEELRPDFAELG